LLHNFLYQKITCHFIVIGLDVSVLRLIYTSFDLSAHILMKRCHHQCQPFWSWWRHQKCYYLPSPHISDLLAQVLAHGDPRGASTATPGEPQYPRKSLSYSAQDAQIQIRQLLLVIKPVSSAPLRKIRCYVKDRARHCARSDVM